MLELSIIIPVYNGEKYIESCLNKILKCKEKNFEVVLLNDGSTDKTNTICEKYKKKDKRIKYVQKENTGVSDTRNYGISIATGKWIMFVDCDDKLDDEWYQIVSKYFNNNNNDVIFFSVSPENKNTKEEMLDKIYNYIPNTYFSSPCSRLYKLQFINDKKIEFTKNIINGEDMLFNAECILTTSSYKVVNKSFYNYRKNVESATNTFNKKIFESNHLFTNKIKELEDKYKYNLQKYISFSSINSIYIFANRLAFIKYKNTREFKEFIQVNKKDYKNKKMIKSKYKKYIITLLRFRLYFIAIESIKLKNIIKKFLKNNENDKEKFIKI